MELIKFTPTSFYSCQVCQIVFESEEYLIQVGYSPLCSNKCLFMQYYKVIAEYSQEMLNALAETFVIRDFKALPKNTLVFEITKKYPKPSLSSINKKVTEMVTEMVTEIVTKQVTRLQHSPFYEIEGDVTEPVTKIFDETKMECNQK